MKHICILFALFPLCVFSQHSINGSFSPASDYTYAFLYQTTPTSSDYVNRSEIGEDGSFSIALDSTSSAGIYKIVYALPPEENNFDLIYNGKESISLNFSSENGLEFTDSKENKLWSSYTKSIDMINQTISNYYTQESTDENAFAEIIKTLKDSQDAFEEASKGTLAETFIKANRPYIPNNYEDLSTYSSNLKATYLDHVDFENYLLQSSDFIIDRVLAFIFGMAADTTNEMYKKDIDFVIEKIGDGQLELKTLLMQMVWGKFDNMGNTEMVLYVTDTYLLDLSKATNFQALTDELMVYKNNTIGNMAQDFDIEITKDGTSQKTTLYELDISEQYLIVFWSSTCGHCLDELPKLKTFIADHPEIEVIAIGLEDEDEGWKRLITEYPNFIHVLGSGKWQNPIANAYGVSSTPSLILLDKQ